MRQGQFATADNPKYGPRYGSRAKAFQSIVRGADPIIHPASGRPVGKQRELIAEFAVIGPAYNIEGPSGETVEFADIHGNFFDLDVAAEQNGWTDEEKEMVRQKLDWDCERLPGEVWHLEDTVLPPPFPKYDSTHPKTLPLLAEQMGLVAECLAYEQQNKDRQDVVKGYMKRLEEAQDAASLEEALST